MRELVEKISDGLKRRGLMLVTAESCTGGMIAAAMTDRSGSSAIFERGFVTYSNQAKTQMLGVPSELIEQSGAVSAVVATAMAQGALTFSPADIAVSVTGIAGPDGGTPDKPVGTVFIGFGTRDGIDVILHTFTGDRAAIRRQSAEAALRHVLYLVESMALRPQNDN